MGDVYPIIQLAFSTLRASMEEASLPVLVANLSALANNVV